MKLFRTFAFAANICFLFINSYGQVSFSSSPSIGTYTGCSPSGTITGSGCSYTFYGGYFDLKVNSINNSSGVITFTVKPCSGTMTNCVFYLKESTSSSINSIVCGTPYPTAGATIPSGSTTYSYDFSPSFTSGTRYYSAVIMVAGTTRAYTSKITITATTSTNQPPTTPSNPSPPNGATGISTSPTLSWTSTDPEGGSVGYDLYWGTSAGSLSLYASSSGTNRSMSGLSNNQTYYWKIISYDGSGGSAQGPVWSFTTAAANQPPTTPSNPSPPNGATGISTSPTLSWTSTDPEGGSVGYDLYWGTSAGSLSLYASSSGTNRSMSGLSNNQTYYWKIISYDGSGGSAQGPVWSFTTETVATTCVFGDCSSSTNCGNTNYQDQTYEAVQYLCSRNIVKGVNGDALPDDNISRAQLAKITLYGLFGDSLNVPDPLVSDYFPCPYADLQQNTYYYQAAKALLYLEYGDGISPFDRDRFWFNPDGEIERCLVLKVMFEAFNIAPETSGTNPFTDYPSNSNFWGYAKKAYTLGVTNAIQFRPYDYCTRAEAFIFLYRIMTLVGLPVVNNILDLTSSSFYVPSNISIASMSSDRGMESGNFNNYTKSCFSIPGRNMSLDFDFMYNSYLIDMPTELYPLTPLGPEWSHTYNIYLNFVYGPTVYDTKFAVHMPDGSLLMYKLDPYNNIIAESEGNYNILTCVSSSKYELKTKNQVIYTFQKLGSNDIAFVLTSIKDRNNNTISLSYIQGVDYSVPGSAGVSKTTRNLSSVADPSGRTLSFTYHPGTNLINTISDPLGRVIHFNYSAGYLTAYTDAKGQNTTYQYGTNATETGLLKTIQLPKGNIVYNEYQQRKLTSTRCNTNSPVTIEHNPNYVSGSNNFYQSTVTIPQTSGQSISESYQMDNLGNTTSINDGNALNISSSYNDPNNPTLPSSVSNNSNGVSVIPVYDNTGNVLQITTSGGGISTTETFQYNSYNDVTQHTDANGHTTYYTYSNGNLVKIKDALNNETNITNNSYGQPTSIINPSGVTLNFGYNSYGNQIQADIPSLGLTATMNYDAASRMICTTNFNGQPNSYSYDDNDNLLTETDALNNTTTYNYDQNDNLLSITNTKGYATTFTYDYNTDWLLSESFQGTTKHHSYNYDGTIKTFTDPNGNVFNYTYDNSGRITNDGYASYSYLSNGNLSSVTKDGKSVTYGYDGLNRITSTGYDGNTVNYSYDNAGNVLTITYPGSKNVTYTYDAVNNLKTVKDWNNNTTTYNYRSDGQLDYMIYPNTVKTTYTYDNAGRSTGMSTKRSNGSGSVIAEYSFVLDPLGNHTQENIIEQYTAYLNTAPATINYSYNNANRIQFAGNILFGFDNNGNTTSKTGYIYSYDSQDNLLSVSGNYSAGFEYDGLGNRRKATRNGVVTNYVLDILGMSNVLLETDASGTPQNYYVYGLGLISRIKSDNTTHYYVCDYRGSTVAITDATTTANITHKYQYDDFGTLIQFQEADVNLFRFVGKYGVMYEDSTLYFMRARYYDPSIGRFLSEDPVWSTNLYSYVNNTPIVYIDPKGLIKVGTGIKSAIYLMKGIFDYIYSNQKDIYLSDEQFQTFMKNLKNKNNKKKVVFQDGTKGYSYLASGIGPTAAYLGHFTIYTDENNKNVGLFDILDYDFKIDNAIKNKDFSNYSIERDAAILCAKSILLFLELRTWRIGKPRNIRYGKQVITP